MAIYFNGKIVSSSLPNSNYNTTALNNEQGENEISAISVQSGASSTDIKKSTLILNECDSYETFKKLKENSQLNDDELYLFPDPIPSAENNVALLGADGRLLDSKKQLTPSGIGAETKGAGLYGFTAIPANSDLNEYTACGYYGCNSSATVTTLLNCPVTIAFTMCVISSASGSDYNKLNGTTWKYRVQRLMSATGVQYIREIHTDSDGGLVPSEWRKILVDNDWSNLKAEVTPDAIGAEIKYAGLYDFTLIPENSDLNDYTACGYYGCDSTATVKTLSNCPVTGVFTMHVYSSDITGAGSLGSKAQCYRVQCLMTVEGIQYIRHLYTNSSKNIVVSTWKKLLMDSDWPSLKAEITPDGIGADPVGVGLYSGFTDIPSNADLNDYTACGYYRCTSDTKAATLTNSPDKYGFTLIVSNPLGYYNHGSVDGVTYTHRLQRMITYKGREFTRLIVTNGSGEATYENWREMAYIDDKVAEATIADKIRDYNKDSNYIQIGWYGDSLDSSTLYKLAGYTSDGKIKEVNSSAALSNLGISFGSWTPKVSGASSYTLQTGRYLKLGDMAIVSFSVYGTFSGSKTARIAVSGCPLTPADNMACGGGNLSGYTAASNVFFCGWQGNADGKFYAVGQETGTTETVKWGKTEIYQMTGGDFFAGGTIAFRVAAGVSEV